MLRVRLAIEPRYLERFTPYHRVASRLRDRGVRIGDDLTRYDALVVQSSLIKDGTAGPGLRLGGPLAVYERSDSATLTDNEFCRMLIKQPNVGAWIKEFSFRQPKLNNEDLTLGRLHLNFINADPERHPMRPVRVVLDEPDLRKICTLMPVYAYPNLDYARTLPRTDFRKRRADLLFAGTVDYGDSPVTDHRRAACRAIQSLVQFASVIGLGRSFGKRQFQDLLTQAKVFVSPYGLGEFSWKDYEAIYAGCILIKPTSSFVTTYGFDIYEPGRFCLECKPDFSDLGETVSRIYDDLGHFEAFADAAREALLRAHDQDRLADDLVRCFRSLVETPAMGGRDQGADLRAAEGSPTRSRTKSRSSLSERAVKIAAPAGSMAAPLEKAVGAVDIPTAVAAPILLARAGNADVTAGRTDRHPDVATPVLRVDDASSGLDQAIGLAEQEAGGDNWSAILQWRKAQASDPRNAMVRHRLGGLQELVLRQIDTALAGKAFDAAEEISRRLVDLFPEDKRIGDARRRVARARLQAARNLFHDKQFAEVVGLLESAAEAGGDRQEDLLLLARSYWDLKRKRKSLECWQRIAAASPDDARAWLYIARCCRALRLWERGRAAAARRLELQPGDAKAQTLLEQCEMGLAESARARLAEGTER